MSNKLTGTKICPVCGSRAYPDTYRPQEGVDPNLRRFMCSGCTAQFYAIIKDPELLAYIDKKVFGEVL